MTDIKDIRADMPVHKTKKPTTRALSSIDTLVVHCSAASPKFDSLAIAKYDIGPNHISKAGLATITYHYTIDIEGNTFYTCDIKNITAHAINANSRGIAVCLMYNPFSKLSKKEDQKGKQEYNEKMEQAIVSLYKHLCDTLDKELFLIGHREVPSPKECPGDYVDLNRLRALAGCTKKWVAK